MRKTFDKIETMYGATVQHGMSNNRVYLMDIGSADPSNLVPKLINHAKKHNYGKIFAKVPGTKLAPFVRHGFKKEATVSNLYKGQEDGEFLGLFIDKDRINEPLADQYHEVLTIAQAKKEQLVQKPENAIRLCNQTDADKIASLYSQVFASYPFPIFDPAFIAQSMQEGTLYAGVEVEGNLVALASAECDFTPNKRYAEMTDFATLPSYRGNGYAGNLLAFLEKEASSRGIQTLYTIARAISPGMNCTFSKAGYIFGGRLRNNTNIGGEIESMNVWYRPTR